MKTNYYAEKLNAGHLLDVYQTALPRVKQYFACEIDYIKQKLKGDERVLEVGAGYGRIIRELSGKASSLLGIDIAAGSIALAKDYLQEYANCHVRLMDANQMDFHEEFDVVLCLQNGLSAIKGAPLHLLEQCVKALVPGGKAYFSTYSEKFWPHRLQWFYEQAEKGLIGEIDAGKTGDGIIVCKDGFRAITFSPSQLLALGAASGCDYSIEEVDDSSLFLVLQKPE